MIKKLLFLLIITVLICSFVFSDDMTSDSNTKSDKAFEFSVGGGFNQSFVLSILYCYNKSKSRMSNDIDAWPYEDSIGLLIPISFVFYAINFFGIGGLHIIGCDLLLFNGFFPHVISLQNKLRIVNKFGNINNKKNWFLFEYGITLNNRFILNNIIYLDHVNNYFYFGPCIFTGYEKTFKNSFTFSIGFSSDILYSYFEEKDYINYSWIFYFGIEARFRFTFYKEFK